MTTTRDHDRLSELEAAMLDFEASHPRHTAAKEDAIRSIFSCSAARYYQILATLIEAPAALAHDPLLIARLRRTRDALAVERDQQRAWRKPSATYRRQGR